ncbi:hypothetical protein FACS18942_08350 [Planctomycetales bacterium]|nr:hypothetical protein FACS18942_08350 [Planctomycetales bacterium]
MIDFSQLKTADEKLIALFLFAKSGIPLSAKEIYCHLHISEKTFYRAIKNLVSTNNIAILAGHKYRTNCPVSLSGQIDRTELPDKKSLNGQFVQPTILKNSHVNVDEHNLTELTNGEIFVEEESATSLPKNIRERQEPVSGTSRGIHTAAGTCPAPFPANSAYSAPQSIIYGELPPAGQTALKTAYTAPNGTAGIITAAPLPQFPKSIAERFLLRQKLEFTAGTIFVSENRPTEYLHRMLAELGIDYVPNSDKPLIATDAYSLFLDGLPKFYRQFHKKPVRYGVDDFILHCLSFLRAKGYPQLNSSESVREFFNGIEREQMLAKNESRNAVPNSKTLALQLIGQMFIEEVYGWNPKLPFIWKQQNKADFSAAVWQAERRLAASNGFEPRRQLFYSMFAGIESVNPPLAVPALAKPAETAKPQAPPKAEPLKYSEVLEQIEAKEKQAEPQKTKPVKPQAIELTAAERAEVIDSLIDKTPDDIERALKLALVQKLNAAKHQTARPPVPALPPALPKEKPKEQPKPETPAKKQKTKEQPDAFKKLRKAFREAA